MLFILMIFSPFIVLGIILIEYLISASLYKRTDYYRVTHRKYYKVRFSKGFLGEYLIYKYLSQYEKKGARFLFNCYLPKENGNTTEIDVIMLYSSGIFVFESKNYGGWIFGSEYGKTWTQTLPNGRRSRKEHFFNPIMQNKTHIKNLERLIGTDFPIHSIIVFSNRCTFKRIDLNSNEACIVHRSNVKNAVSRIDNNISSCLSESQINAIYTKLYPYTQVGDDVKTKHIDDIRFSLNSTNTDSDNESYNICPRCGGALVLRTAK